MIGSHAGGLLGSSQPSIQVHVKAATNIAAKANVCDTGKGTILVTWWKMLSSLALSMFDTDKCCHCCCF